jgi:hypothetical protein
MEESRWEVFNENSLWGYINGGADLYFEYGFKEMSVQDIVWQNERLKIDAYIMSKPESAFGIFSVSRYGCKNMDEKIAKWICIGTHQVLVTKGNLYLSVIAYSGTEQGIALATEIAKKVIEKVNYKDFELPDFLSKSYLQLDESSLKLITGQLAMQNSLTSMEKPFSSVSDYQLWVAPIEVNSHKATLLLVTFQNEEDCEKVALRILENDIGYSISKKDNKLLGIKLLVNNGQIDEFNPIVGDFLKE